MNDILLATPYSSSNSIYTTLCSRPAGLSPASSSRPLFRRSRGAPPTFNRYSCSLTLGLGGWRIPVV